MRAQPSGSNGPPQTAQSCHGTNNQLKLHVYHVSWCRGCVPLTGSAVPRPTAAERVPYYGRPRANMKSSSRLHIQKHVASILVRVLPSAHVDPGGLNRREHGRSQPVRPQARRRRGKHLLLARQQAQELQGGVRLIRRRVHSPCAPCMAGESNFADESDASAERSTQAPRCSQVRGLPSLQTLRAHCKTSCTPPARSSSGRLPLVPCA